MSATVFAIGAIALSRHAPFEDRALRLARSFVERCQNYDPAEPTSGDGGFFFSPSVSDSNKAGAKAGRYTSYGSATADGVRALVRLGADAGDPRVRAARAWLLRHFDPGKNPGDFPPTHEIRRASSYYYYVWSVAHAMRLLGETEWAPALAEALLERQREDGSWANPAGEMREDEPVVATSFSMAALSVTRLVLRAEYRSHRARE